jgi:hypothetical protein
MELPLSQNVQTTQPAQGFLPTMVPD